MIEKEGKKIFTCDVCGNKFITDINETEHPSEVDVYRDLVVFKSHRNQTKGWINGNWHFILQTLSYDSAPFMAKDLVNKSFDKGCYILWSGDSSLLYDIVYKKTLEEAIECMDYDLKARESQHIYHLIGNAEGQHLSL